MLIRETADSNLKGETIRITENFAFFVPCIVK